jgi:hypothetical protein
MCFSASVGIDRLVVNGLILPVEAFTVLLDHFVLILFLQRVLAVMKCQFHMPTHRVYARNNYVNTLSTNQVPRFVSI